MRLVLKGGKGEGGRRAEWVIEEEGVGRGRGVDGRQGGRRDGSGRGR